MPDIRKFLGVLLVMIAMASASQALSSQNFCFDVDVASQSDESAEQPCARITNVVGLFFQQGIARRMLPRSEEFFRVAKSAPEKVAMAKISSGVSFLLPAPVFLSQTGLLPRAPSLA